MEESNKKVDIKAPWRDRFLNVIERTIIELNIEFNNFSIGQIANGESKKRFFDPSVKGIEFADELTVCSAIVNDCLSSPIISGDIEKSTFEGEDPELKSYRVNREVHYSKDAGSRVDITMQRVSQEKIIQLAGGILSEEQLKNLKEYEISFIEAKRARRYSNSSLNTHEIKGGSYTFGELKVGMQDKLDNYYSSDRYFYILVWGVWNRESDPKNTPLHYLNGLLDGANFTLKDDDKKVRWIPLSWDKNEKFEQPDKDLTIERWCWILLAQLTKK